MLHALGLNWFLRQKRQTGGQNDEIRGGIRLLRCGWLPLCCRGTTASPPSFISSFSPALTPKSKAQEKLVTPYAVCVCVCLCDCVSECLKEIEIASKTKENRERERTKLFSIPRLIILPYI